MSDLKQNTASAILIGPFLSIADGTEALTTLGVANIDVDIYKASDTHPLTKTDVTPAPSGGTHDCAHVANGWYSLEITAANVDTLGRLKVTYNHGSALPGWDNYDVLPENVYDSLHGSDRLQVDLREVGTATGAKAIADHVWRRTYANVRASSDGDAVSYRSGLGAMAKLVNKLEVSGSNLLLYHEDDTTAIGTQAITTSPSAEPITALDTV